MFTRTILTWSWTLCTLMGDGALSRFFLGRFYFEYITNQKVWIGDWGKWGKGENEENACIHMICML